MASFNHFLDVFSAQDERINFSSFACCQASWDTSLEYPQRVLSREKYFHFLKGLRNFLRPNRKPKWLKNTFTFQRVSEIFLNKIANLNDQKILFSPGVLLPTYKYMEFHSKQNPNGNFGFFTTPYWSVMIMTGQFRTYQVRTGPRSD